MNIGYVKDMLGTSFFIIAIIFIYFVEDLNIYKYLIYSLLFLFFFIDGFFSYNQEFHSVDLGINIPTFILLLGGCCFILINIIFDKYIK